jgi:hypothetical protein
MSLDCFVGSIINPGYPLPKKYPKMAVQLCICTFCLLYRVWYLLWSYAINSLRIDYFWLILSLCIIVILEMYSRYFDPINNSILASQETSYITRFMPNSDLALGFQRPIATIVTSRDRQNQFLQIWTKVGKTVSANVHISPTYMLMLSYSSYAISICSTSDYGGALAWPLFMPVYAFMLIFLNAFISYAF